MKTSNYRKKANINTINYYYILALIPLIIFGFYKNGIKLYFMDLVSIYGLFKPLIFSLGGFLIGCLVNIIYNKMKHKKINKNIIFEDFYPVYGVLIASVISINTNIYLFLSVSFLLLYITKYFNKPKLNVVALISLVIILLMNISGNFTFSNIYELSNDFHLDPMDYLLGRGSGGINTTCSGLLIISLCFLTNKYFYKKEIPLYSSVVFIILITILGLVQKDLPGIMDNIFAYGTLFSFIFIASDSLTSSYTEAGKIIYSLIVGLFTFLFFLIEPTLAALGGILVASLLSEIIDFLVIKFKNAF